MMYVEKCVSFDITQLRKRGLLKGGWNNVSMSWDDGSSINFSIKTLGYNLKILSLKYSVDNRLINYDIRLMPVESNLKNGVRWYFICPSSGRRCMKLIKPYNSDYFAHRTAHGLIYEQQMMNKGFWSTMARMTTIEEKRDNAYNEIKKKYRKTHYRGKPTPLASKFIRYSKAVSFVESRLNFEAMGKLAKLDFDEIENFGEV